MGFHEIENIIAKKLFRYKQRHSSPHSVYIPYSHFFLREQVLPGATGAQRANCNIHHSVILTYGCKDTLVICKGRFAPKKSTLPQINTHSWNVNITHPRGRLKNTLSLTVTLTIYYVLSTLYLWFQQKPTFNFKKRKIRIYLNKCSNRCMKAKLLVLLGNFARQNNQPTGRPIDWPTNDGQNCS